MADGLINHHFVAGNIEKAESLYGQLIELGSRPTDIAISSLIDLYGRRHQPRQLEDLLASLSDSPNKGKLVYCSMVDAFVNCGKLDEANTICKEMLRQGRSVDAVTLSVLVNALSKNGTSRLDD